MVNAVSFPISLPSDEALREALEQFSLRVEGPSRSNLENTMQPDTNQHIEGQRMILAIESSQLAPGDHGFYGAGEHALAIQLHAAGLWIGPRKALEEMPSFRQLIPYVVLFYEDKIVHYVRSPKAGEARLHGRVSIGLGGHIDMGDIIPCGNTIDLGATVGYAMARELREEMGPLATLNAARPELLGLLVDNSDDVGRVHLGLVYKLDLAHPPKGAKDPEITGVGLSTLEELEAMSDRLENWSCMLVKEMRAAELKPQHRPDAEPSLF